MSQGIVSKIKSFVFGYFAFFALAMGSVFLARISDDVAIFWPANAVIVCIALFSPQRNLLALVASAYMANATTQVMFGDQLQAIFGFPLANATEILVMVWLLRWLGVGLTGNLGPNTALKLLAAAATAAVPAAFIGSNVVMALYGAPIIDTFVHWWAGDIVSSMIIYMPLFAFTRENGRSALGKFFAPGRMSELILVCFSCVVGFFVLVAIHLPPAIVLVFPTLWLALKGRVFEVAIIGSILSLATSAAVVFGYWPSMSESLTLRDTVFQQQIFAFLCTFPSFLIATAIANLERTQELLTGQNDALNLTLTNMSQGVSMFDRDGRLSLWNQKYLDIFGMTPDQVRKGAPFVELLELQKASGNFEGDPRGLQTLIMGHTRRGKTHHGDTILGSGRYIKSVHSPMPVGGWIGTHEDVTEIRLLEERLAYESRHDALTGLANRRYFDQEFADSVRLARQGQEDIALLTIDLDNFKTTNDTYGHDIGDQILTWAASNFRLVIDETGFVARIGGDEFMVILRGELNERKLRVLAQDLLDMFKLPVEIDGHICVSGASIGIAYAPNGRTDAKWLMTQSDIALYATKQAGRNSFRLVNFATQGLPKSEHKTRAAG